ncbi:MAG: universal stress protein [Chloroflexota bacterium]|nr:MAG: universal stress protein [Chloroflexota bacterium]
MRLLACYQVDQDEDIRVYAEKLCDLLQGQITFLEVPVEGGAQQIRKVSGGCDLIVFGEPTLSLIERMLTGHPCRKAVNQAPVSILVPGRPRWPIQNILLIVRVEETDEAAVDWVARLARPSGAKVYILPVLYSFPSVYAPTSSEETALGELLSPSTQPGQQLRSLSQRLAERQIEGTLRFRQGEPAWQIRWEVTEGDYDLIVIGAEPYGSWQRLLMGELVAPMLGWLNRPLLIARPTLTAQSTVGE